VGEAPVPLVTIGGYQYSPVLSNDRKYILFNLMASDGSSDVYLYDRITHVSSQITSSQAEEYYLTWSPDDSRFAYITTNEDSYQLVIRDLTGRIDVHVLPTTFNPWGLSWLPDGENLVISLAERDIAAIYKYNIINRETVLLSDHDGYYIFPASSPTGEYIAFADGRSASITILNLVEMSTLVIFPGKVRGLFLSWSPDGTRLAFSLETPDRDVDIAIFSVVSNETELIENPNVLDFTPLWSPDGSKIVSMSNAESFATGCIYDLVSQSDCSPVEIMIHVFSRGFNNVGRDRQIDW
jgi:Tol biopolymer transport system component